LAYTDSEEEPFQSKVTRGEGAPQEAHRERKGRPVREETEHEENSFFEPGRRRIEKEVEAEAGWGKLEKRCKRRRIGFEQNPEGATAAIG